MEIDVISRFGEILADRRVRNEMRAAGEINY